MTVCAKVGQITSAVMKTLSSSFLLILIVSPEGIAKIRRQYLFLFLGIAISVKLCILLLKSTYLVVLKFISIYDIQYHSGDPR